MTQGTSLLRPQLLLLLLLLLLLNYVDLCGSVKRNSDLRSQFFLHNSEFASTIPFVLEHIVPNSVDVAIAESVDGVYLCV